jgi:hypothetical protein
MVSPTVATRWRKGPIACQDQEAGEELQFWSIHQSRGGKGSREKAGSFWAGPMVRVRAEGRLPHLQEGLGPDSEMQLQSSALLPVQWPELTT